MHILLERVTLNNYLYSVTEKKQKQISNGLQETRAVFHTMCSLSTIPTHFFVELLNTLLKGCGFSL